MRILLAVDDSPQSFEAARSLMHLAAAEQVIVLHALELPWPGYPILPAHTMIALETARELCEAAEDRLWKEAEDLLKQVSAALPSQVGPVSTRIETGSPAEVILNTAQAEHADLIVMGRGREAVPEAAIGSVSYRVVEKASCPTLVVKAPLPSLQRVLLPLQGPEDRAVALRFLAGKPFRAGIEITVLTVLPLARSLWSEAQGPADVDALQARALEQARQFVNGVVSELSALGYVAGGMTSLGYAADRIIRESERNRTDLILIGCRARGEAGRFPIGSVAYAALHRAKKPILVFR